MTDKLPRLNYLTMLSSAIQVGKSIEFVQTGEDFYQKVELHHVLMERCETIYDTLSAEDVKWLEDNCLHRPNGKDEILNSLKEVIELLYAEDSEDVHTQACDNDTTD